MTESTKAGLSARTCWILLVGILLAHGAVNALWVRGDQTMRGFDEPHHVVSACHAMNMVRAHGVSGLWETARGRRAGQWPSTGYVPWVLPGLIFGSSLDALRLFNLGYLAVLMLSLLSMGRRLHSPGAGVLAAALCSLYPAIFGASRHFNQDLPYVAVVAMCMALLLASRRFSRSVLSAALGLGVGFAVVVRPHSAIVLAAPGVAWAVVSIIRPQGPRWRVLVNGALCAVAAAGVSAIWWAGRLDHIQEITSAHYEGANRFPWMYEQSSLAYYLEGFPSGVSAVSLVLLAAAAVGLVIGGDRAAPRQKRPRLEMALIWVWLLGGLVAISLFSVHLNRYQYPLFPAAALICGCGLASLAPRLLRRAVVAAALALGAAGWLLCSWSDWRPLPAAVLDCDPNCSREFGEPFESSGPPHEDTIFSSGLQLANWLDKKHGGGRGVLVRIPNQLRVAMMIKPALMTTLPLLQITHRDLKTYGENQTGEECEDRHMTLGGYSFPLTHLPYSHCYTITDAFKTDHGPRDRPAGPVAKARMVQQVSTRFRDGVATFRLWLHHRCPQRAEPFMDHEKGGLWIPCR